MSEYQFLDSCGKVLDSAGINTKPAKLLLIGIALMIQHECDITITKFGNYHSTVKYKRWEEQLHPFDLDQ